MALPTPGDRAAETSVTTGTGTYNLDGAILGWRTIVAACGTGKEVDYFVRDSLGTADYEIGRGVITDASTDTLTRATIYASSNGGSAVNWGAGTREIVVTLTANAMNQLLADEDIGVTVQAYDADLSAIAALAKTDSNFIVGNGSTWVLENASTARTSLGLGTAAVTATGAYATAAQGTKADNAAAKASNLSDLASASTARDNLGVEIGADVQAFDADLSAIAALDKTDSSLIVGNGSTWVLETGNTLRTSLGLTIGSNVQAYDADLTALGGLAKTDSNFIVGNGSTWVAETGATVRTSLGLGTAATTAASAYATAAQGTTADNALAASAVSTFGGTLIDDANAGAARTTLGLGDIATTAVSAYATAAQGTTADQQAAAMRIDSSGNVGIGATPNAYGGFTALTIGHATNGGLIDLEINGTVKGEMFVTSSALGFQSIQSDDDIIFKGNDGGNTITALTLDMSAAGTAIFNNDVYFGTSVVQGQGGCTFQHGARGYNQTFNQSSHANNNEFITFRNQNTQIGSITTPNASSTSYNTSSDYRLKQNVDYDWNATTECKKLKPCRFKWISDVEIEDGGGATASVVTGFLAHELQAVVPEAASGVKDETEEYINDDGDSATRIKPQGIDQSKIIAILTKTIQELEARITALEG